MWQVEKNAAINVESTAYQPNITLSSRIYSHFEWNEEQEREKITQIFAVIVAKNTRWGSVVIQSYVMLYIDYGIFVDHLY